MVFSCKKEIEFLTPLWQGERLPDGRPKVDAGILERLRCLTLEEAWGLVYYGHGYKFQFQGGFMYTNPDPDFRLVGRAVTATLMPARPDLHNLLMHQGTQVEGRRGTFNQWVIDSLVEDDVVVVDFFDKVRDGTFIGGNLATAIKTRTKRGGAVLWGGIRDMEQIVKIDGLQVLSRGEDPTAIADYLMTGFNAPCRIGSAVCLPGDVVYASKAGVLFIPAHLAEEVVINAEKSQVRDIFGFMCLSEGRYTGAQIDRPWTSVIFNDFQKWLDSAPEAKRYAHLTWEKEAQAAAEEDKQAHVPKVML
jgi:regulator of RNase E activity RraA